MYTCTAVITYVYIYICSTNLLSNDSCRFTGSPQREHSLQLQLQAQISQHLQADNDESD